MTTITRYEIQTRSASCRMKSSRDIPSLIYPGCTDDFCSTNLDYDILYTFESKDAALDALRQFETVVSFFDNHGLSYVGVTEWWCAEVTYVVDEDGDMELDDYGGVWGYSVMPSEIEYACDLYAWNNSFGRYDLKDGDCLDD